MAFSPPPLLSCYKAEQLKDTNDPLCSLINTGEILGMNIPLVKAHTKSTSTSCVALKVLKLSKLAFLLS